MNLTFLNLFLTLMAIVNVSVVLRSLYKHYWRKPGADGGTAIISTNLQNRETLQPPNC